MDACLKSIKLVCSFETFALINEELYVNIVLRTHIKEIVLQMLSLFIKMRYFKNILLCFISTKYLVEYM